MTIVKWDPFRNVATLQERINRIFDDAFRMSGPQDSEVSMCDWSPPVDIHETDDGLVIRADLPGVLKEHVSVEIKDNQLTLRGERFAETDMPETGYIRKERCCGAFHRAFNLQFTVRPETIKANFKHGVLDIFIPKPEEEQARQVEVNID